MAFPYKQLREAAIKNPSLDNNYGINVKTFDGDNGQLAYRIILIYHLTGDENRGGHYAFVDVLDENGNVIRNQRLRIVNHNLPPTYFVTDKGAGEPSGNTHINAPDTLNISVVDNLPSETVTGLNTRHADEEIGNTWGHHSFYVVWQKRKSIVETPEIPPTEPTPPTDEIERIEQELNQEIFETKQDVTNYATSKDYGKALLKQGVLIGLERALEILHDI